MTHADSHEHPIAAPKKLEGQAHPISVYLWIWGLLFVLSFFSYLVDYFHFQGLLRWTLILLFMFLKAGLIIAIYHNLLYYGFIPESITPCAEGVPCNAVQIEWLGFITIPLMGLGAFVFIAACLILYKQEEQ